MPSREEFLEAVEDCELGSASGMKPEVLSGERLVAAITELVEALKRHHEFICGLGFGHDKLTCNVCALLAKYDNG